MASDLPSWITNYQVPYHQIAEFLKEKTKYRPKVGIICGSGLSGLSKVLRNTETFHYSDIPHFPQATVPGHAGELVFGLLGDIECVLMKGRFHFYEGNSMDKVVLPVRVMRLLGVKLLIVTNAAGGLNPDFNVGDIMVIQDHFGMPCMIGNNPLIGANDDGLGPRFPSVSDAYDKRLQEFIVNSSVKLGIRDRIRTNGVYCFLSGPTYESPTECRFLRQIGGDSVGMSTVPEIIAAKHSGMKVLGLSLITNKVVADHSADHTPASHEEVLEAVEKSGILVQNLVTDISRKEILGDYLAALPDFVYNAEPYRKLTIAALEREWRKTHPAPNQKIAKMEKDHADFKEKIANIYKQMEAVVETSSAPLRYSVAGLLFAGIAAIFIVNRNK